MNHRIAEMVSALLCLALAGPLHAQEAAPASAPPAAAAAVSPHEAERKQAFQAAVEAIVRGPAKLPIAGEATLEMPEGFAWIPQPQARRLMQSLGNNVDAGFQGLVVPRTADRSFHFYDVSWKPAGYVKDDDAKDWKADALLSDMREGTEEGNKRRREIGIPEIAVTGWIEEPHYDAASHKLVWSVGLRDKASQGNAAQGLNYQTLVLGREGYLAMVLVTDPDHVEELRPATGTLLSALSFNEGKRYADFQSGTDHVAEFGLAALVAGVAAKKLGLLALMAAFVLKFAKVLIVAVLGGFWAVRKWFGFGKRPAPEPVLDGGSNSVLSGDAVQGNTVAQPQAPDELLPMPPKPPRP